MAAAAIGYNTATNNANNYYTGLLGSAAEVVRNGRRKGVRTQRNCSNGGVVLRLSVPFEHLVSALCKANGSSGK